MFAVRCRDCGDLRHVDELFFHGRCPACRCASAKRRRAATGERALARATNAGTVDRDGQAFRVVQLPPKRRSRRKE